MKLCNIRQLLPVHTSWKFQFSNGNIFICIYKWILFPCGVFSFSTQPGQRKRQSVAGNVQTFRLCRILPLFINVNDIYIWPISGKFRVLMQRYHGHILCKFQTESCVNRFLAGLRIRKMTSKQNTQIVSHVSYTYRCDVTKNVHRYGV